MRKAIYAITFVLLGALIIQSVWGAEAKPSQLLLVRAGNPEQIHDWNDLTRAGLQVGQQ